MNKKAEFFSFVIPSVLAFALSGVYAVVDGFFIGNTIGDAGLAAINIAWPVTALLQAVGTGIGMGGAVQYSLHLNEEKKSFFNITIILLFCSGLLLMVLLFPILKPLLILLGAEGDLLSMGLDYLYIILIGCLFQVFSTGFLPLIRNMGGSLMAMIAMICGFLTNIVLDFLFIKVFLWGLGGAAAATVIGQAVTMILAVIYFFNKKISFSLPSFQLIKERTTPVLLVGLSPFGLTFSPNIILIFMNKAAMIYGGQEAVSCYAVVAYITMIVLLLLQGVGDGSQPLISRCYGSGNQKQFSQFRRLAYLTGLVLALLCMVLLFFLRESAAELFGASHEVRKDVSEVLLFFIAAFCFQAFVRVTISSFYAAEKNGFAYILVYAEPCLLLLSLLTLPKLWDMTGVWIASPLSQIVTAFIAVYLFYRSYRKEKSISD